jgi:Tfp pilus assembly protein PilV
MTDTRSFRSLRRRPSQAGISLLETMVATCLLLILAAGLLAMASLAISTTENQGHLAARTTEYAQDKMEQLLALAYSDSSSDTTQFPASSAGGTGLAPGGSLPPSAAVAGYVDYLDVSGNPLGGAAAAPANWFFRRQWQITDLPAPAIPGCSTGLSATSLMQITVTATVRSSVGGQGLAPQATLTALKTCPF